MIFWREVQIGRTDLSFGLNRCTHSGHFETINATKIILRNVRMDGYYQNHAQITELLGNEDLGLSPVCDLETINDKLLTSKQYKINLLWLNAQ